MSDSELSQSTVVFGLHLWELVGIGIGVGVGVAFVLLLVLLSLLCLLASRRRVPATLVLHLTIVAPNAHPKHPAKPPKDIQEVPSRAAAPKALLAQVLQSPPPGSIQIETGKEHRITFPEQLPPHHQRSGGRRSAAAAARAAAGSRACRRCRTWGGATGTLSRS